MLASRATSRKLRDAILFCEPIKLSAAWNSYSLVIVAFRPTVRGGNFSKSVSSEMEISEGLDGDIRFIYIRDS